MINSQRISIVMNWPIILQKRLFINVIKLLAKSIIARFGKIYELVSITAQFFHFLPVWNPYLVLNKNHLLIILLNTFTETLSRKETIKDLTVSWFKAIYYYLSSCSSFIAVKLGTAIQVHTRNHSITARLFSYFNCNIKLFIYLFIIRWSHLVKWNVWLLGRYLDMAGEKTFYI